jgi:hypothetical protein
MAHSATEAIWHFIGYLRTVEIANATPMHYQNTTAGQVFMPRSMGRFLFPWIVS